MTFLLFLVKEVVIARLAQFFKLYVGLLPFSFGESSIFLSSVGFEALLTSKDSHFLLQYEYSSEEYS